MEWFGIYSLWVWILSLNIMFLKYIHVVWINSPSFFNCWVEILRINRPWFVYPFSCCGGFNNGPQILWHSSYWEVRSMSPSLNLGSVLVDNRNWKLLLPVSWGTYSWNTTTILCKSACSSVERPRQRGTAASSSIQLLKKLLFFSSIIWILFILSLQIPHKIHHL